MAQQGTQRGGGGWLPPPAVRPPATHPHALPPRPPGPGDLLDGALTALGRYGGRLLGALLLGQLGGLLVIAALAGAATLASVIRIAGGRVFVHTLVAAACLFLLLSCALATALASVVLQPSAPGPSATARGLLRAAAPRVPDVFGAQVLALLAVAGPGAAVLGAGLPPLLLLAPAPAALWLGVLLALAPAAAGYEVIGPVAAVRRSARLVRGAWWRTLGGTAAPWALAMGAAYCLQRWLGVPGALLGAAVLLTFPPLAAVLLYADRRIRITGSA